MQPRSGTDNPLSRREFLGASAKNAAGVAAGMVGWAGVASAMGSPSDRVNVGVIGVRGHGKTLAAQLAALPDVHVASLCDVDSTVLPPLAQHVETLQARSPRCEQDFRRVLDDPALDAVVVATPDHWHACMTQLACQAGKDVYLECPATHSFAEGAALVDAVQKSRRVVQVGLQQRSGEHFQSAIEFLRSGRLGTVRLAKAWTVHQRKPIGSRPDSTAPAGVNYDLWLGPAAPRKFNANRFHFNWHWFWDYGSGELGNWGPHLLDVARWGLGVDFPSHVAATGGKHFFHDDQETPDTLHVQFTFPGHTVTWEHRLWSNHGQEGRSAATAFYGDRGTLIVDRGGWKVYGQKETLACQGTELLPAHLRNFIDCIKTREQPACPIETGHISSGLCHLGNIAYRLQRSIAFDADTGTCGADADANRLLAAEWHAPWGPANLA